MNHAEVSMDCQDKKCTFGVKFSQDMFLMESFLIQKKIPYEKEQLENTPMGMALRIKRKKNKSTPGET